MLKGIRTVACRPGKVIGAGRLDQARHGRPRKVLTSAVLRRAAVVVVAQGRVRVVFGQAGETHLRYPTEVFEKPQVLTTGRETLHPLQTTSAALRPDPSAFPELLVPLLFLVFFVIVLVQPDKYGYPESTSNSGNFNTSTPPG
jgi:hypothetical protein